MFWLLFVFGCEPCSLDEQPAGTESCLFERTVLKKTLHATPHSNATQLSNAHRTREASRKPAVCAGAFGGW